MNIMNITAGGEAVMDGGVYYVKVNVDGDG